MKYNIYRFNNINSTNVEILKETYVHGDIVIATEQTAGIGRNGRAWISPKGGLYFSLLFEDQAQNLEKFSKLTLLIANDLCSILQQFAPEAVFSVKWPNDIYARNENTQFAKLAGILTQAQVRGKNARIAIGIGINTAKIYATTDIKTSSLSELDCSNVSSLSVFDALLPVLEQLDTLQIDERFAREISSINSRLLYKNQCSTISHRGTHKCLKIIEINDSGHLVTSAANGEILVLNVGEIF